MLPCFQALGKFALKTVKICFKIAKFCIKNTINTVNVLQKKS